MLPHKETCRMGQADTGFSVALDRVSSKTIRLKISRSVLKEIVTAGEGALAVQIPHINSMSVAQSHEMQNERSIVAWSGAGPDGDLTILMRFVDSAGKAPCFDCDLPAEISDRLGQADRKASDGSSTGDDSVLAG